MSEIKVDTLSTVSGSGNLAVSNNIVGAGTISGTNLTASGTLTSTGLITASAGVAIGGTGAVNTLDDYEEDTWTPVLTRRTSDMTFTGSPTSRTGTYTKIGKLVQINFYIQWATSAVSSAGSGGWRITGLPFSNYATNSVNMIATISINNLTLSLVCLNIKYIKKNQCLITNKLKTLFVI